MSDNKIGGISLDDIMAASDDLLDENDSPVKETPAATSPKKAVSGNSVGGVDLSSIMAAADMGLDDEASDNIRKVKPNVDGDAFIEKEKLTPPALDNDKIKPVDNDLPIDDSSELLLGDENGHGGYSTLDDPERPENGFVTFLKKTSLGAVFAEVIERKNIGLLLWILLNMILAGIVVSAILLFWGVPIFLGFLITILFYLAYLASCYTVRGEKKMRKSFGLISWSDITKYYSDADPMLIAQVHRVFEEVYEKAKKKSPNIGDVELFLMDDDSVNAFALGKRTIIMTKGMVEMPIEQIKAILGHEFGHLAHRDTEILLIPQTGNVIFNRIVTIIAFFAKLCVGVGSTFSRYIFGGGDDFDGIKDVNKLERFVTDKILGGWMSLGTIICTKNNKNNEFAADRYSCELGYGNDLKNAFLTMEDGSDIQGYFATLLSTHPATPERVMNIDEYLTQNA